jgi:hypothetical protein
MTDKETDRLDKFQSKLNSKRTLFNVIVYIILPASLILTFIYSLLLTRENKVDYLLYITFVTIIYSLVVLLINLLKDDKDLIGLRYIINKLGIDGEYDTNIGINMSDENNRCDLSFNYPDNNKSFSEVSPKTSKIIGGDLKTDENDISDSLDKEFYNRCDGLENSDNLFKVKGTCLGKTSSDMVTCANLIKEAKDSDEAFEKCNSSHSTTISYIVVAVSISLIIIADMLLLIYGRRAVSDFLNILSGFIAIFYISYTYWNKPPCDYIDMNYPNIAVSPLPNYLLNSIMLGAGFKIASTLFKIYVLGSPEYTWLIIYFVVLSSTYIIKDYSFISVLEDSYGGFGKFINIMKLDRNTDKINYNMSFIERITNKRCIIDGLWDKNNNSPNIKGDLEGCNSDILGKYLNN